MSKDKITLKCGCEIDDPIKKHSTPEPTLQEQTIDEYTTEYRVNLILDIIEKQGLKDAIGYLYGMTTPIAETQAAHTKREEYADYLAQAIKTLIEKAERKARIDELLQMRKVGDDIAAKDDTDFEDLSGAYDGHILKRLADLTAPKSDTNLVSEGEI